MTVAGRRGRRKTRGGSPTRSAVRRTDARAAYAREQVVERAALALRAVILGLEVPGLRVCAGGEGGKECP
jgi:hypothetical protein